MRGSVRECTCKQVYYAIHMYLYKLAYQFHVVDPSLVELNLFLYLSVCTCVKAWRRRIRKKCSYICTLNTKCNVIEGGEGVSLKGGYYCVCVCIVTSVCIHVISMEVQVQVSNSVKIIVKPIFQEKRKSNY